MMKAGSVKPGRLHHLPFFLLLLILALLRAAAAQSSSSTQAQSTAKAQAKSSSSSSSTSATAQAQTFTAARAQGRASASAQSNASASAEATSTQGAGQGQDCTRDSSVCRRGLLCLPNSAGGRVCRRPKKYEPCDPVAQCDNTDPNVKLGCLPISEGFGRPHALYFPGHTCAKLSGRGGQCDLTYDTCLPGLMCKSLLCRTPSPTCPLPECQTITPAKLGESCSNKDCDYGILCKINKDGSKRCVNYLAVGQTCDPKDFEGRVNPCQYDPKPLKCLNGKCTRLLPVGSPCTLPDAGDQCDAGASCLKSETGALKCLTPADFPLGPCGDAIGAGCAKPGTQCIKGFCGMPAGGQGDVCDGRRPCKSGLQCLKPPLDGAGSRCTTLGGLGAQCDPQRNLTVCQSALKCSDFSSTCISRVPVPRGGTCVQKVAECAPGLTWVQKNMPSTLEFFDREGVCTQLSPIGGPCKPTDGLVCDRKILLGGVIEKPVECKDGKCVNTNVGTLMHQCGGSSGVTCAPRDAGRQLACQRNMCSRVNLTIGHSCTWHNPFAPPDEICAAGLTCLAFEQSNQITKCSRLGVDGERCDYNAFAGCQGANSSCVRGICTSA